MESALGRMRLLAAGLAPDERVDLRGDTLTALLREVDELVQRPSAIPPADLDASALAARERLSPSRTRELLAYGEWGEPGQSGAPYRDPAGRWRIPLAAVLARDERLRQAGQGESAVEGEHGAGSRPSELRAAAARARARGNLRDRQRARQAGGR